MILVLSPTKIFRSYEKAQLIPYEPLKYSEQTTKLIERMVVYTSAELEKLMKVSTEIAECNYERFQQFNSEEAEGYYAADFFYGEAFKALDAPTMTSEGRAYMAASLKILSGLYGCIGAMEVIQPYRLEMGTKFSKAKEDSLYILWKEKLTDDFKELLSQDAGEKVLINLASDEYSKALDLKAIGKAYPVITLHFKVKKGEDYKVVGMYAKKARGLMTRYICQNALKSAEEIKTFDQEGYQFEPSLSNETDWVFVKAENK